MNGKLAAGKPNRVICALICLIQAMMMISGMSLAEEARSKTIRVGFFAFDGYHEIDETGQKSGYGYDFLTLTKRYADIDYEYIGYDQSWNDMQKMLLNGEIDMVTSAHKTAAREEMFDFSLPIGTNSINLNVRADETRYITGEYSGYNGMTVGMIEGSSTNDRFDEFAQTNGFTYTAKYYPGTDELESALAGGEVDAVVTSSLRKIRNEMVLEEFNAEYFYAIVRKGDTELLDNINYAIRQLNSSEGDWKNILYYNNYFAENHSELRFTEEEQAFIKAHSGGAGKVTVAVDTDWIPFSWKENGSFTGILPEMIAACMKRCGMEYQLYDSEQKIIDADVLDDTRADIYFGYSLSDEAAEQAGLVASGTILDCGSAFLVRKETTQIKTVAVCATTPYLNTTLQVNDSVTLKEYPDTLSARNAVINKEADAAFLYDYDAQYTANHDVSGRLAYQLISGNSIQIRAVMRSSDDRTLMGIVMKCFNQITDAEKNAIVSKYISHTATSMTLEDYALLHPFAVFGVGVLFVVLLAIAVIILLRSKADRKHKSELEEKVKEITALNSDLEENQVRLEEATAEQEAQIEEISALNVELEANQVLMEESAAEQEAQLEEISALNSELEASKEQLQAAAAERENRIEEITALNDELNDHHEQLRKYAEEQQRAFELLREQSKISGALNRIYVTSYYLDIEANVFREVDAPAYAHVLTGDGGDANDALARYIETQVKAEFRESMYSFTEIATLRNRLGSLQSISHDYETERRGWFRADWVVVTRGLDGLADTALFCVKYIDEDKQKEIAHERFQAETIERQKKDLAIVSSLANVYISAYYIDLQTELFRELKPASINALRTFVGEEGNAREKFHYMHAHLVVKEQVQTAVEFTELDTLPDRLSDTDKISFEFRGPHFGWCRGDFVAIARDENGRCTHVLWLVSSIREQKEQQKQLKDAMEAAEAANNAKTSFLFNMSHDIRTPMNAIIGFRDLLEKHQEEPEKRRDYLRKIEESSNVLLSIINNVLEMARIEKGTVEMDETAWSAEQFNDTLYSIFREMMRQKNLAFTTRVEVQNPYIYCDPIKLREVFINILSNAYKYTNAGGSVDMLLEELPCDREGYVLHRTTITDTGIGMSEEFLPHIFEEFSREHTTTDNKIEGTGLGMPIVKRLVTLMEGTIEVRSKVGVGSTFIVTIPHRVAEKSSLVEHAGVEIDPKLFKDKRILLAEDNELNAEIAIEILTEAGFIVDRAEDGAICCDMLSAAPNNHYDLILMDIQMPNMNGYEAARTIRKLQDSAKAKIPIIAMTANAFEEDKREALRAGMDGHLAKPINVSELMKALARMLG